MILSTQHRNDKSKNTSTLEKVAYGGEDIPIFNEIPLDAKLCPVRPIMLHTSRNYMRGHFCIYNSNPTRVLGL